MNYKFAGVFIYLWIFFRWLTERFQWKINGFSNEKTVMTSLFLTKKTSKEIHEWMMQTLVDKCQSVWTVKKLCVIFQREEILDSVRSWNMWPFSVHYIILEYRQISTKRIVETLKLSRKHIGFIIYKQFDMQPLLATWADIKILEYWSYVEKLNL